MRPDGQRQSFTHALRNAGKGLAYGLAHERNVQIDACFAVVAIALAFALRITAFEWLVIVACIGLVLACELLNTALESVVDLATSEFHELAGRAKDCAAGACLVASLASLVIGIIIFAPRLWALVFGCM